jgi:hypothetical protein
MNDGLIGINVGVYGHGDDALVSLRFDVEDDDRPTIEFRFDAEIADDIADLLKSAALIARLGGEPSPN